MTGTGFLRAVGPRLVDGSGREVVLRGVGLGNWLVPEGYMWRFPPGGPQSPTEIGRLVADLLGAEGSERFWRAFRERFITEEDVQCIAAEGFDHVRLPMSHRLLADELGQPIAEGYELIDRLVGWCRASGLRVVLDLHAAPGGQTGTNIDDSGGTPALFVVGEPFRARTIKLWADIARRYAGEPVIAAYDLLNEPLPPGHHHFAPALVDLYRDTTATIRGFDPDHLITYEGTHWSTDWSIFSEPPDPNSMLQFHKYWSPPDLASIEPYLRAGDRLGLPIYMGEGGENAPPWLQCAFGLYDRERISWNFWPWKKIATWSSPYSIQPPDRWAEVTAYASGQGERPSRRTAGDAFAQLLDNFAIARCQRRPEVLAALFRRAPVRLAAEAFTASGGIDGAGAGNDFRREAEVRVRSAEPGTAAGFDHADEPWGGSSAFRVLLAPGEWVEYDVAAQGAGANAVTLELEGQAIDAPRISAGGRVLPSRTSGRAVIADLPAPEASGWRLRVTAERSEVVLVAITVAPVGSGTGADEPPG